VGRLRSPLTPSLPLTPPDNGTFASFDYSHERIVGTHFMVDGPFQIFGGDQLWSLVLRTQREV